MKESRIEQGTRVFFWIGYAVFLAASIPHIATYFRHFDPMHTNFDWFYWLIGYALAIVIDISDVLVSIAVIKAQAHGAKWHDLTGYWLFIGFITALSWLMNWQYNVVFGSSQFHVVDAYRIAGVFSIGQLNPIVGSAFQLLLLVYTGMAHKFSQKTEHTYTTLEALQQEASEATQKAALLKTIQDAQKIVHPSAITRFKETALEAKKAVHEVLSNGTEVEVVTSTRNTDDLEPPVEPEAELIAELFVEQELPQKAADLERTPEQEVEQEVDTDPEVQVVEEVNGHPSRSKVMTVKEAAAHIGCSERHVRNLRGNGTLNTDGDGLSTKSVKAYARKRQKQSA